MDSSAAQGQFAVMDERTWFEIGHQLVATGYPLVILGAPSTAEQQVEAIRVLRRGRGTLGLCGRAG